MLESTPHRLERRRGRYGTPEEEALAERVRYFREQPFLDMLNDHEHYLMRHGEDSHVRGKLLRGRFVEVL